MSPIDRSCEGVLLLVSDRERHVGRNPSILFRPSRPLPPKTRLPATFNSTSPPSASACPQLHDKTMAASRQSRGRSADGPTQELQAETAQATSAQQQNDPSTTQPPEPTAAAAAQRQSQEQQQPPPSPPLPQRHTAVTPGPRASRFRELYAQSLRRTLGKAGWENFSSCYPTVARNAEGVLKQVQGQMVDKLGEKCEVRTNVL